MTEQNCSTLLGFIGMTLFSQEVIENTTSGFHTLLEHRKQVGRQEANSKKSRDYSLKVRASF